MKIVLLIFCAFLMGCSKPSKQDELLIICKYIFDKSYDAYDEKFNTNELDKMIEEFSKGLKKYEMDNINYLKEKSKLYIDFQLSFVEDNFKNMEKFVKTGEYNNTKSEKTIEYLNKLKYTSLYKDIEKSDAKQNELLESINDMRKKDVNDNNYKKNIEKTKDSFRDKLKDKDAFYKNADKIYKDTYERIFGEKY